MSISLSNIDNSCLDKLICDICHDIDGNIYLRINKDDTHIYYFLTIDSFNNLEWIHIEDYKKMKTVDKKIMYKTIQNSNTDNSLRKKAIDELCNDNVEKDIDELEDTDAIEYKARYKYYPEDAYYYVENDDDGDDDNDDNKEKCYFSKYKENILIFLNKTLDVSSNYDTFIFDDIHKTIVETIESYEKNNYRIVINISHKLSSKEIKNIELNIVGTCRKLFELKYTYIDSNINIVSPLLRTNVII